MNLFLYGPSGSGKSTVGELLAQSLDLPFIDLDLEIEKILGKSNFDTIACGSENVFRDAETEVLKVNCEGKEKVIALGGGALLRDANRKIAEGSGKVIFLDCNKSILEERLSRDSLKRPLLAGVPGNALEKMLEDRKDHYRSFPFRIDATLQPKQIAWNILSFLGRFHLRKMGKAYDVIVSRGSRISIGNYLKSKSFAGSVLLVSDTNVSPLYANQALNSLEISGFSSNLLVIPAGEKNKTFNTVEKIWHGCLEANLDRQSIIVALGGGVVCDLSGFAAATFMRGCKWIAMPTTLLAMVDASIGGKTGFDLPEGKNLIGAFYPPRLVIIDPDVLSTLPVREYRAGLAEVVKHGIIADPELFDLCSCGINAIKNALHKLISRALAVKVKIIEDDPYENNSRAALNFGHTVGHAVEIASNFTLRHGEAVSIGMIIETKLAEYLSIAKKGISDTIAETLMNLDLPTNIPDYLSTEKIHSAMNRDKKKSGGKIHFALPEVIGKVKTGVEIKDLYQVLEEIR